MPVDNTTNGQPTGQSIPAGSTPVFPPAAPVTNPVQAAPVTNSVQQPTQPVAAQPASVVTPAPTQPAQVEQSGEEDEDVALPPVKYNFTFKNVSYEQLMSLLNSSTILESADIQLLGQVYEVMKQPAEIDKAFNAALGRELEFLEAEIADIGQIPPADLQADQATTDLFNRYKTRLNVLSQVVEKLKQTNL